MTNQVALFESPQIVLDKIGRSGSDLKSITKSFYDTLQEMMKDFADPNKDMVIKGIPVAAKDKYGVLGTMLFGQYLTDNSQVVNTVLNTQSAIYNLEKQLTAARTS